MIGFLFLALFASVAGAEPVVPERAQAMVGKFATLSGPNCWNSALYATGLVRGIRHVDYAEFTAWLASPLCEEVEEKAAVGGEIVALRRVRGDGRLVDFPYTAEIHGYLLLAPGTAFTKNGIGKGDGYEILSTEAIRVQYESTNRQECRILGLPKELCQMKAQYFRCSPDARSASPAGLKAIEEKVDAFEADLHRFYTENPPASLDEERSRIKQRADALEAELDAAAATDSGWQIELLRLRLVSDRIVQF